MNIAMAVVTLTLGLTSGNLTEKPTWLKDYQVAQAQVSRAGKPMVVFVGNGATGYTAAVRERAFDPAVSRLLSSKFVCVYVDTTTDSGRKLADAFEIKEVGVVISDRSGNKQAFSAATVLASADLEKALVKYADEPGVKPNEVVPAGGPVPAGGMVVPAGAMMGGPGYGYGYGGGYGGGVCGQGGYGYGGGGCGFGGGCCGKGGYGGGFGGGGCCFGGHGRGNGYGAPVMVAAPAMAPGAPVATMPRPAPLTPMMAGQPMMVGQPMNRGGGCCGSGGFGGGCCGFGGGRGYGYGGYGGGCGFGGCCGR